jgi:hypothetical protein
MWTDCQAPTSVNSRIHQDVMQVGKLASWLDRVSLNYQPFTFQTCRHQQVLPKRAWYCAMNRAREPARAPTKSFLGHRAASAPTFKRAEEKRSNTNLARNVVSIPKSSELLLAGSVPHVEANWAVVRGERQRPHVDTKCGCSNRGG